MVATLAGVGAWAATVSVSNGSTIYASELFGEGHSSPVYPDEMTPMVVLTIPANLNAFDGDHDSDAATPNLVLPARDHNGSAEITFTLSSGVFDANIAGLMYDADGGGTASTAAAASASVASIVSGGRKGDASITIKIEEAGADADTRPEASIARETDGSVPAAAVDHTISFTLPRLASLGALAGANALDANPKNDQPKITVSAASRIISGAFSDGSLTGLSPPTVISSRDSVTLEISDKNEKMIAIDGDGAFMSVKGANKMGYVELATITIETKQIMTAAKAAKGRTLVGYLQGAATETTDTPDDDVEVYLPGSGATDAVPFTIYDLDGEAIDEGLRGVLMVSAMGTRDLFNEGDMLFVDYDKNGKMGPGEEIAIDGDMAMSNALSVDPDKSESFTEAGTGSFKVYYMAGGKDHINHEAMINVTAMVHYSDPSANNEPNAGTSTTLKFDGVGNPVMAYAIPHSTNGVGDKANVRVRCEASAGCRVFAECWDDMGNRGFGEGPMIAGNNVMVANSAAVEAITGLDPMSRISCRVLSKGAVTVQQLTRDGNSGTLVNNTYVGQ